MRGAADLIRDNHRKIDILVNNAGVMSGNVSSPPTDSSWTSAPISSVTTRSPDGCSTVSTPVWGGSSPSPAPYIVKGSIDFDDLPMGVATRYPPHTRDRNWPNSCSPIELQRRLAADGMAGASLASHPGRATAESCVSRTRS